MFHELLYVLGAGLVVLYLLSRIAADGPRRAVVSDSLSNNTDPNVILYKAAEELFEQGEYAPAAATVTYVTSADNDGLAGYAWLMLARCRLRMQQNVEAIEAADCGLKLVVESTNRDLPEMRWLRLTFLMVKVGGLTQISRTEELQWRFLEEARSLAEASPDAFEWDEQRNLYLAVCYHNLAVLTERAHNTASASVYYERAAALWETLPNISNASMNLEDARSGLRACGSDFLDRLFGLDYEGPDS